MDSKRRDRKHRPAPPARRQRGLIDWGRGLLDRAAERPLPARPPMRRRPIVEHPTDVAQSGDGTWRHNPRHLALDGTLGGGHVTRPAGNSATWYAC